jgi:septum formation protein
LVLAADTVVALDGVIFGKPRDEGAARIMLRQLRGRRHAVTTAVVARRGDEHWQGAVAAAVTMRAYSDVEIANYVATGEPLDKAGAYAVQGLGGKLVQSVEGCLNTVIGLPLCIVAGILSQAGYPAPRLQGIVCRHVAPR